MGSIASTSLCMPLCQTLVILAAMVAVAASHDLGPVEQIEGFPDFLGLGDLEEDLKDDQKVTSQWGGMLPRTNQVKRAKKASPEKKASLKKAVKKVVDTAAAAVAPVKTVATKKDKMGSETSETDCSPCTEAEFDGKCVYCKHCKMKLTKSKIIATEEFKQATNDAERAAVFVGHGCTLETCQSSDSSALAKNSKSLSSSKSNSNDVLVELGWGASVC